MMTNRSRSLRSLLLRVIAECLLDGGHGGVGGVRGGGGKGGIRPERTSDAFFLSEEDHHSAVRSPMLLQLPPPMKMVVLLLEGHRWTETPIGSPFRGRG